MDGLGAVLAKDGFKLPAGSTPETEEERIEREQNEARVQVERWRLLPPTEKLAGVLDRARSRRDIVLESFGPDSRTVQLIQREVSQLEVQHAAALERDRVRDERFVAWGCQPWCLGQGWRRETVLAPREDGGVIATPTAEYCVCPEGLAAREEIEGQRRRHQAELRRQRFVRLFGQAHIPIEYAESTLDNHPNRRLAQQCREWLAAQDDHDSEHPWLYLYGGYGSGKTSAAIAICREWMMGEHGPALVRTLPDLLEEVRATYGTDRMLPEERAQAGIKLTSQLLQGYVDVSLLVLDDVAAENLTERNAGWVEEQLYKLLNSRHNEHRHTILTSNLPMQELSEVLGDRIFNRVLRMARPVWAGSRNYREREV